MTRIKLSHTQAQYLLAKLLDIPVFPFSHLLAFRIERALKRDQANVEAIRVYLPELMKEIDQTVERGETPILLIKRTVRRKTGKPEIEIVFMGTTSERHVEELTYFTGDPKNWRTWGLIVLTVTQAEEVVRILQEMVGIKTLD